MPPALLTIRYWNVEPNCHPPALKETDCTCLGSWRGYWEANANTKRGKLLRNSKDAVPEGWVFGLLEFRLIALFATFLRAIRRHTTLSMANGYPVTLVIEAELVEPPPWVKGPRGEKGPLTSVNASS